MLKYLLAFIAFSVSAHAQLFDAHEVSENEASKLTAAYHTSNATRFRLHAGTLPKESFAWLMERPGAAALTYYWGMDESGELHAIYVATTASGADILGTDAILCPRFQTMHSLTPAANILTKQQAVEMMRRYRKSALFLQNNSHRGASIARASVLRLVQTAGTAGVRSYFARNPNGSPALVFVGTTLDANDNTILFLDRGRECPPDCPIESELLQLSALD